MCSVLWYISQSYLNNLNKVFSILKTTGKITVSISTSVSRLKIKCTVKFKSLAYDQIWWVLRKPTYVFCWALILCMCVYKRIWGSFSLGYRILLHKLSLILLTTILSLFNDAAFKLLKFLQKISWFYPCYFNIMLMLWFIFNIMLMLIMLMPWWFTEQEARYNTDPESSQGNSLN